MKRDHEVARFGDACLTCGEWVELIGGELGYWRHAEKPGRCAALHDTAIVGTLNQCRRREGHHGPHRWWQGRNGTTGGDPGLVRRIEWTNA